MSTVLSMYTTMLNFLFIIQPRYPTVLVKRHVNMPIFQGKFCENHTIRKEVFQCRFYVSTLTFLGRIRYWKHGESPHYLYI